MLHSRVPRRATVFHLHVRGMEMNEQHYLYFPLYTFQATYTIHMQSVGSFTNTQVSFFVPFPSSPTVPITPPVARYRLTHHRSLDVFLRPPAQPPPNSCLRAPQLDILIVSIMPSEPGSAGMGEWIVNAIIRLSCLVLSNAGHAVHCVSPRAVEAL